LLATSLSACGGGDGDSESNVAPVNRAPVISGVPVSGVVQNTSYRFAPGASDPDADSLSFSVGNLPAWATFDTSTGGLSGTPGASDIGSYQGISIGVSDGQNQASLPMFDIEVMAMAQGSLTVSWTPPVENEDGSSLGDLAGYRLRWGWQSGSYPNAVDINGAGLTRFLVDNLVAAEYFVVISAIDSSGNESSNSNEARGIVE
jgi:hypothetical protein